MALPSRKISILNTLSLREKGLIDNNFYQEEALAAVLDHSHQPFKKIEDANKDVQFLRTNFENKLIGVDLAVAFNYKNKKWSYVSYIDCTYSPSAPAKTNEHLPLVSTFKVKNKFRECMVIKDTADVNIKGLNPLLYAGNYNTNNQGVLCLNFFNVTNDNRYYEWKLLRHVFCCTSCNYTEQFAAGVTGGYFLFSVEHNREVQLFDENVLSLQFSENGNLLFLGTNCRGVSIRDVREHACHRKFCSLTNKVGYSCKKRHKIETVTPCAKEMKLLDDQISLIVADKKGYTEKVDIRMMKTVLRYPGHVGHNYRRCLCINEDLDLISSAGSDKKIRVWTLGSGKLIYQNEVWGKGFVRNLPAHCCFLSNQRRWFLSVIQDGYMVPIVPTEF